MPIYEYRCQDCRKRTTVLLLSIKQAAPTVCQHCGGTNLERLLSKFASPKSEEARLDALADPGRLGGLDENDPAAMARFMKTMGKELGEDIGDEVDAAMEEGSIEKGGESTSFDG
jgi:putative FmdB family regulatory protein